MASAEAYEVAEVMQRRGLPEVSRMAGGGSDGRFFSRKSLACEHVGALVVGREWGGTMVSREFRAVEAPFHLDVYVPENCKVSTVETSWRKDWPACGQMLVMGDDQDGRWAGLVAKNGGLDVGVGAASEDAEAIGAGGANPNVSCLDHPFVIMSNLVIGGQCGGFWEGIDGVDVQKAHLARVLDLRDSVDQAGCRGVNTIFKGMGCVELLGILRKGHPRVALDQPARTIRVRMVWTGFGRSAVGSHRDRQESALSRVLVGEWAKVDGREDGSGAPMTSRQGDGGCRATKGRLDLDGSLFFPRLTATDKRTVLGVRLIWTGLECHPGPRGQVRGRLKQPSQSRRKVGKGKPSKVSW
ncbi:hypothetical protein BJV74DRAFT_990526 [Russula compacta]|nr:hypothetical protein BJV74DRAFT_990526 [Russula compacta]